MIKRKVTFTICQNPGQLNNLFKVDVFDLPRIAKKLKTFHFDQGVDEGSLSLDNIISISTSTSSNSASSNSFGSKEPPSPDIY